jgi:hypothetical protein
MRPSRTNRLSNLGPMAILTPMLNMKLILPRIVSEMKGNCMARQMM